MTRRLALSRFPAKARHRWTPDQILCPPTCKSWWRLQGPWRSALSSFFFLRAFLLSPEALFSEIPNPAFFCGVRDPYGNERPRGAPEDIRCYLDPSLRFRLSDKGPLNPRDSGFQKKGKAFSGLEPPGRDRAGLPTAFLCSASYRCHESGRKFQFPILRQLLPQPPLPCPHRNRRHWPP